MTPFPHHRTLAHLAAVPLRPCLQPNRPFIVSTSTSTFSSTLERLPRIAGLAWPIILSNITVPLLGLVDTAVVGHLPDSRYLAGVTLGATLFGFLYWGFGFLRMGTTGLTSQAVGREDDSGVRLLLAQSLVMAVAIGLALIGVLVWSLRAASAIEACMRAFGGWVVVSATVHPWYLLWLLPWAAVLGRVPWLVLSASALCAYLPTLFGVALLPWPFLLVWIPPLTRVPVDRIRNRLHRRSRHHLCP